uniref:Integrase core domain containing protein n=1 Tax=Solanum tuberosum TaxID=4113 RepID=M1DUV3_SOLTU
MWTMVRRSIYGLFCTSVVSIYDQYYWSSDPRKDGECVEWVVAPRLGIRKATLNFVANFFWFLVRNRVSPTKANNQFTWDRAIMVAAVVAEVEIDFTRMLLAEIYERAFKTSTTYPFRCLIFQLCRDSGLPIWHCDRLIYPTGTLDIGLIRDEANVAAPRSEPQIEVPPLGADLADMVGQAQGGDPIIRDHSDTVPTSSSQATSMAPISSQSTPQLEATVFPLAKWDCREGLEPTHAKGKRHRSNRTEEEKAQKRQRRQEKEDKKASILDEQLRQHRVRESVVRASSSAPVVKVPPVVRDIVSTTDGAMMDDVGTTEGDPTIAPAGSGKPDSPAHA